MKCARHRTRFQCLLRNFLELRVIDSCSRDGNVEIDLRDGESATTGIWRDGARGIRIDRRRRPARALDVTRQRHAKARGLGRCKQLFGIGSYAFLESRAEAVLPPNRSALALERPLPALDSTFPTCTRSSGRHSKLHSVR